MSGDIQCRSIPCSLSFSSCLCLVRLQPRSRGPTLQTNLSLTQTMRRSQSGGRFEARQIERQITAEASTDAVRCSKGAPAIWRSRLAPIYLDVTPISETVERNAANGGFCFTVQALRLPIVLPDCRREQRQYNNQHHDKRLENSEIQGVSRATNNAVIGTVMAIKMRRIKAIGSRCLCLVAALIERFMRNPTSDQCE